MITPEHYRERTLTRQVENGFRILEFPFPGRMLLLEDTSYFFLASCSIARLTASIGSSCRQAEGDRETGEQEHQQT
ncbi:MAG: hypothetical protein Q8K00_13475 [Syntrophales bacterium]|nr:hypothetical protein [Syntrophales bacterium]